MKYIGRILLLIGLLLFAYKMLDNNNIFDVIGFPILIIGALLISISKNEKKNKWTILVYILICLFITLIIFNLYEINNYPFSRQYNRERIRIGIPVIENNMHMNEYPMWKDYPASWQCSMDLLRDNEIIHLSKMVVPALHREYDRFLKRLDKNSAICFDMDTYVNQDSINYDARLGRVSLKERNYLILHPISYTYESDSKSLNKKEVDSILSHWGVVQEK